MRGMLAILWFCFTFPSAKWDFSICSVLSESLFSSLLLFSSLRFFFASLLFFSFQAILPSHHNSIFPLPLVSPLLTSLFPLLCFFFPLLGTSLSSFFFSSVLLLSSFLLWSLRTSHQAITPSHHHSIFPLPVLLWPGPLFALVILRWESLSFSRFRWLRLRNANMSGFALFRGSVLTS